MARGHRHRQLGEGGGDFTFTAEGGKFAYDWNGNDLGLARLLLRHKAKDVAFDFGVIAPDGVTDTHPVVKSEEAGDPPFRLRSGKNGVNVRGAERLAARLRPVLAHAKQRRRIGVDLPEVQGAVQDAADGFGDLLGAGAGQAALEQIVVEGADVVWLDRLKVMPRSLAKEIRKMLTMLYVALHAARLGRLCVQKALCGLFPSGAPPRPLDASGPHKRLQA